jgi:hypothetical protein
LIALPCGWQHILVEAVGVDVPCGLQNPKGEPEIKFFEYGFTNL